MKMTLGIIITLLIVITGIWIVKTNRNTKAQPNRVYNKEEAENFVKRLEELEYFKYAEHSDLDNLKKDMLDNYGPDNTLSTIWDENTGTPKDFRCYSCDGETVYEQGGITGLLNKLKPTFDKLGFKCDISNHFEEWDDKNKWLNHRISINGTEYIIFKNFTETGWGEAPKRIAEILNIELAKQGIDEQIYLASGGNDGFLVFLNNDLYKYIYSVYQNPYWKPLELNEWAKAMKVEPMKLD